MTNIPTLEDFQLTMERAKSMATVNRKTALVAMPIPATG